MEDNICVHREVCNRPCPYDIQDCPHLMYECKEDKIKAKVVIKEGNITDRYGKQIKTRKFVCGRCGSDKIQLYDLYCSMCGALLSQED